MQSSEADADFLSPTRFLDSDHPGVLDFATGATTGATSGAEAVRRLYTTVRDTIWYDPYEASSDPADYCASAVLTRGRAYCIPKAVLLSAAARAIGIPARLGFADVRNHLQTDALRERMGGSDLFVFHGYSELLVEGRWVKAAPAFNRELCARFGVEPIPFDGRSDALLHAYSGDGSRHMEYVRQRGWYPDLPLEEILATFRTTYSGFLVDVASGPAPTDEFRAGPAA